MIGTVQTIELDILSCSVQRIEENLALMIRHKLICVTMRNKSRG